MVVSESNSFSLHGQGLKLDSEKDIQPYVEKLKAIDGLKEISLGGNTFGVGASKALAQALQNIDTLEVANLADMFTGRLREEIPSSLDALLTSLLTCKNLHTVDLSDNALGIATIEPLEKFLESHTPLQHLILANNGLGPFAGARVAQALEKLAEAKASKGVNDKLVTVICGRNRLENGSMEAWSKFLAAHGTIKELRLYQNGIRQEGIEHLMLNGLAFSPALEKLDLQDNTFTIKGAKALASVVSKWPKIKEIGISDCLLSKTGGEALARALLEAGSLENLEALRLQYNEIDAGGLQLLKSAIELNIPNLKELELNGNKFSEDDDLVDQINELFSSRGFGELDDLDDMEEDSEDEEEGEEEEEEEVETDEEKETILRDAEVAEESNVAPEISKEVDELANLIAKSEIGSKEEDKAKSS